MEIRELKLPEYELKKIKRRAYLGSEESIYGLFLSILGMTFSVYIITSFNSSSFIPDSNFSINGNAKIVRIENTYYKSGGRGSSKTFDKYEYEYEYDFDGSVIAGFGYGRDDEFSIGDYLEILIYPEDIHISRAKVLEKSPFSVWWICILIFPIIGFIILGKGLNKGKEKIAVLASGMLTNGKYEFSIKTKNEKSFKPIYDHRYSFKDENDKTFYAILKNTNKKPEQTLRIIFNRENPQFAFPLRNQVFPGIERLIDEHAELQ